MAESAADEIAKLAALREAGEITAEEFQTAKSAVFNSSSPASEMNVNPPSAAPAVSAHEPVPEVTAPKVSAPEARPVPSWLSQQSNAVEPKQDVDNSRVWLLAVAPILLVCIDAAFLYSGAAEGLLAGLAIAFVVNTAIVVWDSQYLKRNGFDVSAALGILLVPAYLAQRSSRIKQNQSPLVAWIVAFVIGIGGSALFANNFVQLNMSTVNSDIAHWIQQRTGANATVQCPSKSVYSVHSTFLCSATSGINKGTVQVTVQNSSGDITWQAIG